MLEFSLAPRRDEMTEALCKILSIESVKSAPQGKTVRPENKRAPGAWRNRI